MALGQLNTNPRPVPESCCHCGKVFGRPSIPEYAFDMAMELPRFLGFVHTSCGMKKGSPQAYRARTLTQARKYAWLWRRRPQTGRGRVATATVPNNQISATILFLDESEEERQRHLDWWRDGPIKQTENDREDVLRRYRELTDRYEELLLAAEAVPV